MKFLIWRDPGARTRHIEDSTKERPLCSRASDLNLVPYEEGKDTPFPICEECLKILGTLTTATPPMTFRA